MSLIDIAPWEEIEYNIYFAIKRFFNDKVVLSQYRPVWLYDDTWNSYEFDICLPNDNIAIEYNGDVHNKSKDNTEFKRDVCNKMGYHLLVIGTSDNCDCRLLQKENEGHQHYLARIVRECIKYIIYNLSCSVYEKEKLFLKLKYQNEVLLNSGDFMTSSYLLKKSLIFSEEDFKELVKQKDNGINENGYKYTTFCIHNKYVLLTNKDLAALQKYFCGICQYHSDLFVRFIDMHLDKYYYGFTLNPTEIQN